VPRLSTLLGLSGVDAAGSAAARGTDPEVTRVDYDSRCCVPGSLFVAVAGFRADGHRYSADAVRRGAVAVVAERAPHPRPRASAPLIIVSDSRVALSALAAALYERPSARLRVVGVTGTDGKTTTVSLIWSAWRAADIVAGATSTIEWRIGDTVTANSSRQTTLEAPDLHERLATMRDAGCTHAVLEVSSHGLELHRVDDVDFAAAVYTRVTSEHLELHGDRDAYLAAKARLLSYASAHEEGVAVLDADDEFAFPTLGAIPVARRLTYSAAGRPSADVTAGNVRAGPDGVQFDARTPWGRGSVGLRLTGTFNVANALAALAAACATGASFDAAVRGVESLERVSGRMERIALGQPFDVVVDYAHTAESLQTVLLELRASTRGRLWVVFGSAGERDTEKRAAMGTVAARLADVAVITDEDPRQEDRLVILEQIAAGATAAGGRRGDDVVVIPDRAEAITHAVRYAAPGDTVLCAGKGHERSLIVGTTAFPWDERAVAEAAIRAWLGRASG